MAAGEYVSVSSQRDAERADIDVERRELFAHPEAELQELTAIYQDRGLPAELAAQVAEALTERDALQAHVREELGLASERRAQPLQAAWASGLAFSAGVLPPVVGAVTVASARAAAIVVVTLIALAGLGAAGARLGGAPWLRATARVTLWGAIAMAITAGVGALVGAAV